MQIRISYFQKLVTYEGESTMKVHLRAFKLWPPQTFFMVCAHRHVAMQACVQHVSSMCSMLSQS